jgi:acetyl-CoA acyltransferase 1
VIVDKDDGIRHDTTIEGLRKIRPAFKEYPPSHSTGGNSSQITDGAAAVVLMRRSKAKELGLKVLARYVVAVTTGHEPRISED